MLIIHKINVNYVGDKMEDIMHANGLEYDAEEDQSTLVLIFYSEVWVIDHTTTEEAATESGGNKGFGGDLHIDLETQKPTTTSELDFLQQPSPPIIQ